MNFIFSKIFLEMIYQTRIWCFLNSENRKQDLKTIPNALLVSILAMLLKDIDEDLKKKFTAFLLTLVLKQFAVILILNILKNFLVKKIRNAHRKGKHLDGPVFLLSSS